MPEPKPKKSGRFGLVMDPQMRVTSASFCIVGWVIVRGLVP